jgi:pimeloyl-ACP methyl ester carboxylesterase
MRRHWGWVIPTALAIVVAAGCGSSKPVPTAGTPTTEATSTTAPVTPPPAPSTTTLPAVAPLTWAACGGSLAGQGLQCATLQVPLDYSNPAGPTIGIALDKLAATGSRIGSLLINPGGPGGSGIQFLADVAPQLSSQLTRHFDVIGFDPRGVGASDPIICGSGPELDRYLAVDEDPTTPAGVAALVAADRTLVQGCQAHSAALLGHVGTVDAARDMDRIRQAVGDAKLNYLGFSYGTFLGATYADEFPTHIRAMVLDGAEDPALAPVATVDTQATSVDTELGDFFDWCADAANSCAWKPAGARAGMQAAVLALVARARQAPLAVSGDTRTVGPTQVLYGTAEALYEPQTWPDLGTALAQAANGNGAGLLGLFDQYVGRSSDGTYTNLISANNAVSCDDQAWPSIAQTESDAAAAERAAPVFGMTNLYSGLVCAVWPDPPTDHPHPVVAAGSPPIVVVGSTGDPATPYAWAQALASQLARGVLVTRVGVGHTGYLASSCVRALVDTYMVDLGPPAAGTRCASDVSGA